MSSIKEMRKATWNGVIPSENAAPGNAVPYDRGATVAGGIGVTPIYPEISRAGIKPTPDQLLTLPGTAAMNRNPTGALSGVVYDPADYSNYNYEWQTSNNIKGEGPHGD